MKGMLRRRSQPCATTIKCQEIIEIIPGASTLRTNTTTSISLLVIGLGGYQWRAHIAVQKKSDFYGSYWADALGLELSIKKDGKAAITPTGNLIPGTSFIQGWGLPWEQKKQSVDPNIYTMLFSYGEADHPYKGAVQIYLYMNADQDTIVIRRGIIIEADIIANIPDYIPPGGYLAEVCTLRRVKK